MKSKTAASSINSILSNVGDMVSLATASCNTRIKRTEGDYFIVSTIRLAVDHSFGAGQPQWYETMVFKQPFDGADIDMERYETKEEALKGHDVFVDKYIKGPQMKPLGHKDRELDDGSGNNL